MTDRSEKPVPEGPVAHAALAALARRFEEVAATHVREFGIVKSDLTAVRLQIGNLDQKVEALDDTVGALDGTVGALDDKVGALDEKIDRNQGRIIELLTQLVGRRPEAG